MYLLLASEVRKEKEDKRRNAYMMLLEVTSKIFFQRSIILNGGSISRNH